MHLADLRDPRTRRGLVSKAFLRSLLASPEGRAHALTQAGIAERTDEGEIFERILAQIDAPDILQMVKKHAADEERHAQLFFECADRQGVGRPNIANDLQVLELLNQRIGLFDATISDKEDVADAYLVLQVIEERAIEQFSMIEPILRRHDPVSADTLAGIARDEERHLRYCRAISAKYSASEEARSARLTALREAEADAFREHQQRGARHILAAGMLPWGQRVFWRTALDVLGRQRDLPYTRFHESRGADAGLAA